MVECKWVGCHTLFREFFIRQSRRSVLGQWRNWRKQKIRRAVNKSTQKLILSLEKPEATMAAAVHFLPEGRPDNGDNYNAEGGEMGKSNYTSTSYNLLCTSTTANLYRKPENIKLISIEKEGNFHEKSHGCRRMQWLGEKLVGAAGKSSRKSFSSAAAASGRYTILIDLNRSTFLIVDFGSSKPH